MLVQIILFHIRQQARQPTPAIRIGPDAVRAKKLAGWKAPLAIVVILHGQGELPQIVQTLGAGGGFTHALYGGQEQAEQHANDCDYHQQLQQRESHMAAG